MNTRPRPDIVECPACGAAGKPVALKTVLAIVRPGLGDDLASDKWRLCRAEACDVLYFGERGLVVHKGEAAVRVGLKESSDPIPLCYCFGFSRADVRAEVGRTGDSTVPAIITARVRAHQCSCDLKNPTGACCLGEVNKAVSQAKAAKAQPGSVAPVRDET